MKEQCRNCVFSSPFTVEDEDHSIKAQAEMKAARESVIGKGKQPRLAAIEKVALSPKHKTLQSAHGGLSMSKKETDIDGTYVVCSNPGHLKDEKATKKGIVHKYYFHCLHFFVKD